MVTARYRGKLSHFGDFFFFNNFAFLFLAVLGLHCHAGSPPVVASGACSRAVVLGFLTTAALLVAQHRLLGMRARELWHVGSAALVPGLWSSGSIVAPRHVASSGVRH